MKYLYIAFFVFMAIIFIYEVLCLIKTNYTFTNRVIIINAIYEYHMWCFNNNANEEVDYTDMEDYDETDKRWNDWGYTNILPKAKFEIIKPFIKEKRDEK